MDVLRTGDLRGADAGGGCDDLQETQRARALLLAPGPIERCVRHEQRGHHRANVVFARLHTGQSLWITPVIIFVLWIGIQFGLGYRHRRST